MIERITDQQILMVGTGYVGLITAVGLAKLGNTAHCYDINPERITNLRNAVPPFYEPQVPELVQEGIDARRLFFYETLAEAYKGQRYVFIGVQTPQDATGKSDLSALFAAVNSVAEVIDNETLIIVKSTVAIGVFDELAALPAVQGKPITFVSCPEFLAEGTAVHDFFNPKRTIVGSDSQAISKEVAGLFYGLGGKVILTDAKTAQMIKYGANSFLATRIAFINDIAEICEKFGVNVHDVTKALVMDPRVGGTYLTPSIGFAGPCLPKDTAALIESSERVGAPTLLLRGVLAHNEEHLRHVIDSIIRDVPHGATIAMFGLSFKPNTDDVRNSFSLKIARTLLEKGFRVQATDPHAIKAAKREINHENLVFYDDPLGAAAQSHLQLFMTPWQEYWDLDLAEMGQKVHTKHIFDAMQVVDATVAQANGFVYRGVGTVDTGQRQAVFDISDNPVITPTQPT